MEILLISFLTAVAFIIVMFKIGMSKFTRWGWQSDLLISGIIAAMFFGTFSGMVIGIMAGIFVSLFLSVAKALNGPAA